MSESASPEIMAKLAERFGGAPLEETHAKRPPQEDEIEATESAAEETGETVEQEESDGLDELIWDGQALKVPKGLKEAVMRTEDYTRKTQELAEQRRTTDQVKSLAETHMLESAFNQSVKTESDEIGIIDAYLKNAANLDWSQLTGDQLFRQKIEFDNIKDRRAKLADSINGKRSQFIQQMEAKIRELKGKAKEIASKSITGFNEETEKTIREHAKSKGLDEREIDRILLDPRSYTLVWEAAQYSKVKAGTLKATETAERVLKPGTAGVKMPKGTADKLNFGKAMNKAKSSSEKASLIEDRLARVFVKR